MKSLVDIFYTDFKEILDKVLHKTQLKTSVSLHYTFVCNWELWRRQDHGGGLKAPVSPRHGSGTGPQLWRRAGVIHVMKTEIRQPWQGGG